MVDKAYLIDENENYEDKFGFGLAFEYNGKRGRAAVTVNRDATLEDFKEAWALLKKAIDKPDEYKIVWDKEKPYILIGNELNAHNE